MNDDVKKNKSVTEEEAAEQGWVDLVSQDNSTAVMTNPDGGADDILDQANQVEPSLICIQGDLMGKVYRFPAGKTTLGRHQSCDLYLQQRAVSSRHIEFSREENTVIMRDLGSTNGTMLNRRKIDRPTILQNGDLIKVGTFVFRFADTNLDASFVETLHQKGSVDELTGAYNKAHITQAIESSMEVAKEGYPLSLIVFDLDHFKQVNDQFGHIAGDYVLKETCRIIRDSGIRSEDLLGRFGGEEFILLMPDSPLKVAIGVAERIRGQIEQHDFVFEGKTIPVTASLGVSNWLPKYKTAHEFIDAIDKLLYKSKQNGRNRVSHE